MWDAVLEWVRGLSPGALYAVGGASAAAENVFPPLPSDAVVAIAAFSAARGRGSARAALAAVLAGNAAGAMAMYGLGARFGASAVLKRLGGSGTQERKLRAWYARYGLIAIAVSRFVPGVRAVVPPVAGALRIGALRSAVAMIIPSAIWYGAITYAAFTAGGDFDALRTRLAAGQRWVALAASGVATAGAIGGVLWWAWRRRAGRRS